MDITEVLAFSAQQGASGLHLSAGLPPMIRVDGDLRRRKKKVGDGSQRTKSCAARRQSEI